MTLSLMSLMSLMSKMVSGRFVWSVKPEFMMMMIRVTTRKMNTSVVSAVSVSGEKCLIVFASVSYTHLTLPTIYSV